MPLPIWIHVGHDGEPGLEQFLRPGREQVGAGTIIYGSSTALMYTDGERVDVFTLDPASGEFFLVKERVTWPETLKMFSANSGNAPHWSAGVKAYVDDVMSRNTPDKTSVKGRHIGSFIIDLRRTGLGGTDHSPAAFAVNSCAYRRRPTDAAPMREPMP